MAALRPVALMFLLTALAVASFPALADPPKPGPAPAKPSKSNPVTLKDAEGKEPIGKAATDGPKTGSPKSDAPSAPPADEPAAPAPAAPVPGAVELQSALGIGFKVGTKQLALAQVSVDAARRISPDDPRIDYGQGLIFAKQVQWAKAQTQFEQATKRPGKPYWPAWQAWVWCAFKDKQPDQGFSRLQDLAKRLTKEVKGQKQSGLKETGPEEIAAAKWTGWLLTAVIRSDSPGKLTEKLNTTTTQLQSELGEELFKSVEAGKVEFFNNHQQTIQQAQAKAEAKAKAGKEAAEVEQAKLDGNLTKAAKEKEDAKKSAEEWKTWVQAETAKIDKELAKLEKDYKFGQQRADSLNESITLIGQEMTVLLANEPSAVSPLRAQWENQYLGRQNRLNQYQSDYNNTVLAMTELSRQGVGLMGQRQQAVQRYEKATGELLDKSADLDKWSSRLADKKGKLQAKVMKPVNSKTATTFTGYLPLDLEAERDRLLRDVGLGAAVASP